MPTNYFGSVAVALGFFSILFSAPSSALQYEQQFENFNLNQNKNAVDVLDYSGTWDNHTYHRSPSNWRIPFYTLFLDKFVNGDPTNDDINGTVFEHDVMQTQLRHGGDLKGLVDSLDYLQGMGIEAVYIAGTPFINQPWDASAYSPLDLSLLDQHFGDIQAWRDAITEIHRRGMYVMLDNTVATMGDLIGFKYFLNSSAPFSTKEYKALYKDPTRQYFDFDIGNNYNDTCAYPRFWLQTGFPVGSDVTDQLVGCYDSEFDQYGEVKALGDFLGWELSLSKAAGVQDRLRDWVPSVLEKINHFSCLTIKMLDIDGFRLDKATQTTVDALGDFSQAMRDCAKEVGKENFFIAGEISGGNAYGSVFLGRGRQPNMALQTELDAVTMTNNSKSSFIRDDMHNGLDAAAFHYSVYRSLTRLLGMDGIIEGLYDTSTNLVDAWNTILLTNDLVNPNTGVFDPRHMFGTTNQDNFRWPAIANGTEKMLLGQFLTTLHMPGIPVLLWGEEQAFYVLDSTSDNYIFGRQAMSSAQAWKTHGCYSAGSSQYNNFLVNAPAKQGCIDDWNTLDHRDPANPVRNIIKSMYQMRKNYPALNDGWLLKQLSNQTHQVFLPASNGTATEVGMWSTMRGNFEGVQNFSATAHGSQYVWLVYQNDNKTVDYKFDCTDNETALVSPFNANTTVKNLFYPYDELTLITGPVKLGISGSGEFNGCLKKLTLLPWEFRAYVPKKNFVAPRPMITKFLPGHDARLQSTAPAGQQDVIPIELHFSDQMNCTLLASSIKVTSTTEDGTTGEIDRNSVVCSKVNATDVSRWIGGIPTVWVAKANLVKASNGVHVITVTDVISRDPRISTQTTDHFFVRIGQSDNPMVFPQSANYTTNSLNKGSDGNLFVIHKAAGADQFRYSLNWGSTYSAWQPYTGGNTTLAPRQWSGTQAQNWNGEHVILQYYSGILGSSDHVQHADLDASQPPRRFPHLFVQGAFNQFGTDSGLNAEMQLQDNSTWTFDLMAEWPATLQLNEWGINPDGNLDQSFIFGDIDRDNVLDRLPPSALAPAIISLNSTPPSPFLAWKLSVNDGTLRYDILPVGNRYHQLILYILLWLVPIITATFGVWAYLQSYYKVKFNKVGVTAKNALLPFLMLPSKMVRGRNLGRSNDHHGSTLNLLKYQGHSASSSTASLVPAPGLADRRTVLIATMEYDIEDWGLKVKIGGLGVMAQLMGKNLGHQDLIWVVPCVGGLDYPVDSPADPMDVTIIGKPYEVKVQYHVLKNITYVLLDAPVFRAQSKAEPYPARMDDIDSAIYYSAWNQCIALAIKRFSPDLYHINDYHGALAPVFLLPETIPCALSLHNAEFQGLWGMRTQKELNEVCQVFNVTPEIAQKYVQFGDVFNLLHAGASYLRIHQKGFGAVGVSKKYGKRAWARYPIFWGLKEIGQLPNPDPSDTAEWSGEVDQSTIVIDEEFEKGRGDLRKQAQEWAGLEINPNAELLVFVGRWSMQKGVDLIADAMPALLDENENVQLICIGPVIDLYGKFAALKLGVLMKNYPGRVFSKPEFTALPPHIFSGAEFALIPSRDEPFGLVAVEFGRKGALGIGARVGGLGQMPGWWYTVESTTTAHLTKQFKRAIKDALTSKIEVRRMMRARSAKQRFPVAQWVGDLEKLQTTAIDIHTNEADCGKCHNRSCSPRGRIRRDSSSETIVYGSGRSRAGSIESRGVSPSRAAFRTSSPDTRRHLAASAALDDASRRRSRPGSLERRSRSRPSLGHDNQTLRASRSPLRSVVLHSPVDGDGSKDMELEDRPGTSHSKTESSEPRRDNEDIHHYTQARPSSQAFLSPTPDIQSRPIRASPTPIRARSESLESSASGSPSIDELLLPPSTSHFYQMGNVSTLSLESVVGTKKDFSLQKVDPSFTDSTEEYYKDFEKKLRKLDASNSESVLCIEDYLVKSEKAWFARFSDAKLGRGSRKSSPAPSIFRLSLAPTLNNQSSSQSTSTFGDEFQDDDNEDEFLLGGNYKPPRGIKKLFQYRIGDWPVYTFFLALGQIMAANSYQITLLSGNAKQDAAKFYLIAGLYLVASISWWLCYRFFRSLYILTMPFIFYALAFLVLGIIPFVSSSSSAVAALQNTATGWYTVASASGSLYFALNFGDEGGSPIKAWVFRACIIQGTQQIYICALWFWGAHLTSSSPTLGYIDPTSKTLAAILLPVAAVLFIIALLLYIGLPDYYRQQPGKIPSFYMALFRRKIILWFFVTVLLQNFFLSTLAGRNWTYLWSSQHAAIYQIVLFAIFFFLVVWAAVLYLFGQLSLTHPWILPIFAVGLGAPRWAQILWSCSSIGLYLPWAGSPLASALLGRSLWLWLGVLDALQGVGFGMILLQTLTRVHISFTLVAAQVIGSATTMLARAVGPDRDGPATVFPDFSAGVAMGLMQPWFWVGLVAQISISVGFFTFFRKEQLSKP